MQSIYLDRLPSRLLLGFELFFKADSGGRKSGRAGLAGF